MEKIRNLDLKDFYAHIRICLMKEVAEKEFQALLAGASPGRTSSEGRVDRVLNKEQQRGSITQKKTEKAMSFSSKVRKVKITKPSN